MENIENMVSEHIVDIIFESVFLRVFESDRSKLLQSKPQLFWGIISYICDIR